MVTTQPLVARNVPQPGMSTEYVGVSSGLFEALAPNGYVRWRANLGVIPNSCTQLETWGVTGTPVIDAGTRAVYVADAFGWLHALDLATGRERTGWPVRLYADPDRELVWGALADVRGSIYAGTGSYCDQPMEGKVVRVELATRRVTSWTAVPASLGGGGSVWGWGGVTYSTADDALFVVTGNAFEGGANTGSSFSEAAGYGERLVELTRDLHVVADDHPPDVPNGVDSDFVGSPVIVDVPQCGELVAAANKNGRLYLWHGNDVAHGFYASVPVQAADFEQPLLTNPAYDPALRSFYLVTFGDLVRVNLDAGCQPTVSWRRPFGQSTLNSSPTVAGDTVWLALSGKPGSLLGVDARTGVVRFRRRVGGVSFAAPAVLDSRLFEDGRHGFAVRDAQHSKPQPRASVAFGSSSWSDARDGWQSRETGVFATNDGGRQWRRIFPAAATRVVRTSPTTGIISVGIPPTACNCETRRLWTSDGGRHWHATEAIGPDFSGTGATLLWWHGTVLERLNAWPPQGRLGSHVLARFGDKIVDAAPAPDGAAVLLTHAGRGWDSLPPVALVRSGHVRFLELPRAAGSVLATGLDVSWPSLTVRAVAVDGRARPIVWRSKDGGRDWTLSR